MRVYTKKTHCARGHEIAVVGRDTGGACKGCNKVHQREYTARKLRVLHDYKTSRGCSVCGYNTSGFALDFHHRDPADKAFGIGRVLGVSWERIWDEVAKCDVLCRNCHAELHHKEREPECAFI